MTDPLTQRIMYVGLMAAAIITGGLLWSRRERTLFKRPDEGRIVGLAAFLGAMIGAKLPYVIGLERWDSAAWWSVLDGKSILGGIFGGYLTVEATKFINNIRVATGDGFAIPVSAAVCIGRLACFFGGCCFGTPSNLPWACDFGLESDPPGLLRHPIQIYEAVFHATALLVLWTIEPSSILRNHRLKAYLLAYLVFRFVTEWIRPHPTQWFGIYTDYQFVCILLAIALIGLWIRDQAKRN